VLASGMEGGGRKCRVNVFEEEEKEKRVLPLGGGESVILAGITL